MPNPKMTSRVENESVLVLERTFDAPQAMVFKAYSKAEHLKHWWGSAWLGCNPLYGGFPTGWHLALLHEMYG